MKKSTLSELYEKLSKLDGQLYKKYKTLEGEWCSQTYSIIIDKTQPSPVSPPSYFRIKLHSMYAGFPLRLIEKSTIPLSDFILRQFTCLIKKISHPKGSGKSGKFYSEEIGQEIIEKSSVYIDKSFIELRFRYGLPGIGNRIDAVKFREDIEKSFSRIISDILTWENYAQHEAINFINCYNDQNYLREQLEKSGLVAFIPDGAIIPRTSSFDHSPMKNAIPFTSPENLKISFMLPFNGKITGMGIKKGITLIVGGGYHGKTTLLSAIKFGIYNHIPGDGREYLVCNSSAFKINSEDGRFAEGINITPFISNLPLKKNSSHFSSEMSSGSTSQAATLIETLRMNSRLLLFDEDSSSTNFLMNDCIMEELIGKNDKTIIPFVETIRDISQNHSVSSIIVAGSFSPFIGTADLILKMSDYKIYDITVTAKNLYFKHSFYNISDKKFDIQPLKSKRIINSSVFRIVKRPVPLKNKVTSKKQIEFGNMKLNFYDNEQIIDIGQAKTILKMMIFFENLIFNKSFNLEDAIINMFKNEFKNGLNCIAESKAGLTAIRPIDFAHALNRFRLLKIKSQ